MFLTCRMSSRPKKERRSIAGAVQASFTRPIQFLVDRLTAFRAQPAPVRCGPRSRVELVNPTMVRTTLPRPARLALRLMAVSGVALATANCATTPQQKAAAGNGIDPKYGVRASPR